MERKVVAVCLLISFLSLLSAGLAFAAEITKIKASGLIRTEDDRCLYPGTPASLLGMLSTLFFMFAHIGIYAAAGCMCCKTRRNHSGSNWTIALICYAISWVTFLPASLLLLHGAFLNDQGSNEIGATSTHLVSFCDVASDGIFSSGAVLVLTSNFLGMVYYLALRPIKGILPVGEHQLQGEFFGAGDIVMGQPQFPPLAVPAPAPVSEQAPVPSLAPVPASTQPVFVHEDTYNRMQFA